MLCHSNAFTQVVYKLKHKLQQQSKRLMACMRLSRSMLHVLRKVLSRELLQVLEQALRGSHDGDVSVFQQLRQEGQHLGHQQQVILLHARKCTCEDMLVIRCPMSSQTGLPQSARI